MIKAQAAITDGKGNFIVDEIEVNDPQHGDLLIDELVTRTYALAELGQAFEDMHKGINAKGVLLFE